MSRDSLDLNNHQPMNENSNAGVSRLEEKVISPFRVGDVITNSIGMKLVWIPPGEFMMGSDEDEREYPIHKVRITKGFWMCQYEVTREQHWLLNKCSYTLDPNLKDLPLNDYFWEWATGFCERLSELEGKNYRLPTEAQWEYACRAGSNTKYCFGDDESLLDEYAWYYMNSEKKPHPVGQKKPNAWGLYDMHGNADELCRDQFWNGWYSKSSVEDPLNDGDGDCYGYVIRGGHYSSLASDCRSSIREYEFPPYGTGFYWPDDKHGFRVVLEV
jgi:eukaryotic-like serine/threonine-protein kinase